MFSYFNISFDILGCVLDFKCPYVSKLTEYFWIIKWWSAPSIGVYGIFNVLYGWQKRNIMTVPRYFQLLLSVTYLSWMFCAVVCKRSNHDIGFSGVKPELSNSCYPSLHFVVSSHKNHQKSVYCHRCFENYNLCIVFAKVPFPLACLSCSLVNLSSWLGHTCVFQFQQKQLQPWQWNWLFPSVAFTYSLAMAPFLYFLGSCLILPLVNMIVAWTYVSCDICHYWFTALQFCTLSQYKCKDFTDSQYYVTWITTESLNTTLFILWNYLYLIVKFSPIINYWAVQKTLSAWIILEC